MAETKTAETKKAETKKVKTVRIQLPISRDAKDDVFVAVNGKRYQIKRGVEVDVPWYVAKTLARREKMLAIAIEYEEQARKSLEEITK